MQLILHIATYLGAIVSIVTVLTKVIDSKLTPIDNKIDSLSAQNDDRDRKKLRLDITSFASSLHRGEAHTREEFEAIFELVDIYEDIIDKRKLKNNYFQEEVTFIRKCYEKLDKLTNM